MLLGEPLEGKWSCGGHASSRMETVSVLVASVNAGLDSKVK